MQPLLKLHYDNTRSVAELAKKGIPYIPVGCERQLFFVGQTLKSSSIGRYKPGYEFTIVEAYPQNGYWYYVDNLGAIHRTKDIEH